MASDATKLVGRVVVVSNMVRSHDAALINVLAWLGLTVCVRNMPRATKKLMGPVGCTTCQANTMDKKLLENNDRRS